MNHKCDRCTERAVCRITEIEDDGDYKEFHLCFKHAQDYLNNSDESMSGSSALAVSTGPVQGMAVPATIGTAKCPVCNITFSEFRSTGRLGCPHDYEAFAEELKPLIANIHGGSRHIGKVPRRLPVDAKLQTQLIRLRQELQQAVAIEDYEQAARIRDQIEALDRGQS